MRKILVIALIVGAFALWQWLERRHLDGDAFCYGTPRAAQGADMRQNALLLRNEGFTVGYSDSFGNPLWVVYRLHPPAFPPPPSRPEAGFQTDGRSARAVAPDAFHGTGYQRGHLAPNYAMYRVHGPGAQRDSFLMTNVAPQMPSLNQKAWQRLEEVVMDHLLPANGPLCVLTGPLFGQTPPTLPSGVTVPEAFYKILVSESPRPRALALVIPQHVAGTEPLDSFVVTVDEIERRSGLDFLHGLEDSLERNLERIPATGWGLEQVARLPPRY